ncbi:MAG: septum site-determining protein MinC [Stanieria sp.]
MLDFYMTSDPISLEFSDPISSHPLVNQYAQVSLKSEDNQLLLVLLPEAELTSDIPWSEVWQELKHSLQAREQSWQPGTKVTLVANDRLLDARQLQTIVEILNEAELSIERVCTSRRQTAIAAATAGYSVEQTTVEKSLSPNSDKETQLLAEPLYLQNTVRSGVEIRHPGTVVVLGDLNPGGKIIAAGDIFIWGRLRGVAHAGAFGNRQCRILALKMEPTQLRIADAVARSPKLSPKQLEPEVAYVTATGIRLAKAIDFVKNYSLSTLSS